MKKDSVHNGNEAKLLASLKRGRVWSRKQCQYMFKLKNPSAAILRMEEKGVDINRFYQYNSKAKTTTVKYYI